MKKGEKLWFRRKLCGWGWYPSSWEGALVMVIYVFFMIMIFSNAKMTGSSLSTLINDIIIPFVIVSAILITLCYTKGEKPQWQWKKRI